MSSYTEGRRYDLQQAAGLVDALAELADLLPLSRHLNAGGVECVEALLSLVQTTDLRMPWAQGQDRAKAGPEAPTKRRAKAERLAARGVAAQLHEVVKSQEGRGDFLDVARSTVERAAEELERP